MRSHPGAGVTPDPIAAARTLTVPAARRPPAASKIRFRIRIRCHRRGSVGCPTPSIRSCSSAHRGGAARIDVTTDEVTPPVVGNLSTRVMHLCALTVGERVAPLIDCVIGASDGSALFVGDEVPVRRGEPGWAFVVVHVIASDGPAPAEGADVSFTVDATHRAALSAGHTACHLAAVALNAALADRWRKPVRADGLGHPDFDQLAIVSSRIEPNGAIDTYRLGRSLRKKAHIELVVSGPRLTDLREWVCALPEGTQRIPCGGTHLRSLAEVDAVSVALVYGESIGELVMTTQVRR
jgi:alanyl-tRNA synthetase